MSTSGAAAGELPEELPELPEELGTTAELSAAREEELLRDPTLRAALEASAAAARDRSDTVVVSALALALGLLALFTLLPYVLGPAALGLALWARSRQERFATLALWGATTGLVVGSLTQLYLGGSL